MYKVIKSLIFCISIYCISISALAQSTKSYVKTAQIYGKNIGSKLKKHPILTGTVLTLLATTIGLKRVQNDPVFQQIRIDEIINKYNFEHSKDKPETHPKEYEELPYSPYHMITSEKTDPLFPLHILFGTKEIQKEGITYKEPIISGEQKVPLKDTNDLTTLKKSDAPLFFVLNHDTSNYGLRYAALQFILSSPEREKLLAKTKHNEQLIIVINDFDLKPRPKVLFNSTATDLSWEKIASIKQHSSDGKTPLSSWNTYLDPNEWGKALTWAREFIRDISIFNSNTGLLALYGKYFKKKFKLV